MNRQRCNNNNVRQARNRLCLAYIITSILIGIFVYALVSNTLANNRTIQQLQEDINEMMHVPTPNKPIGTSSNDQSKQLTELIHTVVKMEMAYVLEELKGLTHDGSCDDCSGNPKDYQSLSTNNHNPHSKPIGNINYASEELGATIQNVQAEPVCECNFLQKLFGLEFQGNPPVNMIRQSMEPGNCFGFKNTKANVTIKLARKLLIENIELEHIDQSYAPITDISSAPKEFAVYGICETGCTRGKLLGKFKYDNKENTRAQLFPVNSNDIFQYVRFQFESNYGNPNYTAIYRVAVYGKE